MPRRRDADDARSFEPDWILERTASGRLYWRRDDGASPPTRSVKFRHEVEVKEFRRDAHEFREPDWARPRLTMLNLGVTCAICLTVTVILPWYLLGGIAHWIEPN
ncbi:uncharacterized protein LOC132707832 [Cylas formicarius]|uniref:uncharacterized protein LOC132707832 n=1 Tax=Cylas formicarius TaxID=197179 RepID=UPI0029584B8F|nr:uncharacterized protein LOC132707832 [Cylas formicarius]